MEFLSPWRFLQTTSLHRRKHTDHHEPLNLLGRPKRLVLSRVTPYASLNEIHD